MALVALLTFGCSLAWLCLCGSCERTFELAFWACSAFGSAGFFERSAKSLFGLRLCARLGLGSLSWLAFCLVFMARLLGELGFARSARCHFERSA